MKNVFKSISVICLFTLANSCTKDDQLTDHSNIGSDQILTDAVEKFSQFPTGGIKLTDEAYNSLPRLDLNNLKPLPGFEWNQRASSKVLSTPPVSNQGGEGSCTAFAGGYCLLSYYKGLSNGFTYNNNSLMSPEFLYNNTKTPGACTTGVSMPTVLNFLVNTGLPSWQLMPYSSTNGCSQLYPNGYAPITKTTTKKILNPKLGKYITVTETTTSYPPFPKTKLPLWRTVWEVNPFYPEKPIKDVINSGRPVIGVFRINDNFTTQTMKSPFCYTSQGGKEKEWHAVVIIGYNDSNKRFKVQNSWGTASQDKGYFYVSYGNIGVFKELYTIL